MKRITGRKTSTSNDAFKELYLNFKEYISREETESKFEETASWIRKNLKGKKVALGYSGGKDSILLKGILDRLGIEYTVLVGVYGTTYQYVLDFINENIEEEKIFIDCGMSMEYLSKNPNKLFTSDTKVRQSIWANGHQKRIKEYAVENDYDVLLFGRRSQENNVYKNNMTTYKGLEIHLPIASWLNEEVLGYLGYQGIKLPAFYETEDDAFISGSVFNWNTTTGESVADCWDKVYRREPIAVMKASKHIDSAKYYLKKTLWKDEVL